MIAQINPFGILLGLVFAIAIGASFFWMLRVAPATPLPVARGRRPVEKVAKILVPIVDAMPPERAVELACRWANIKKGELVLVRVVVLPDILSLNVPMPEEDKAASQSLNLAYEVAERHGCRAHMYLVHHRNMAEGILQVARKEQVNAIMLGLGTPARMPGEWRQTGFDIMRRAECEVFVDQVPLAVQPTTLRA